RHISLTQIAHALFAEDRDDVAIDSANIGSDCCWLLGPTAFALDKSRMEIVDISFAELLDRHSISVLQLFFSRIIALSHAPELCFRLASCSLRRPDAVKANGEPPGRSVASILDHIAAFARREDSQSKSGQVIVPDDVVVGLGYGALNQPFRYLWHGIYPFQSGSRVSTT